MRQYSIQSVLDWLDFKGFLKDRAYAEATILCDLNAQSRIKSLKKHVQPANLSIALFASIAMIFILNQVVPEKHQLLAFVILTIGLFTSSLLPQKPQSLSPILIGCFVAIGLECAHLTLTGIIQPLYHQFVTLNIGLHVSLLLIMTMQLFTLKRDNNFNFDAGFFTLSFVLSALGGLLHPAILVSILIALTSYKQANLFMVGFGLCLVALFSGWYIYDLEITWHQKSILMMGIGIVLFVAQSIIQHFDWQNEG